MPTYKIYTEGPRLEGIVCAKNFIAACHLNFEGVQGYDRKSNTYWGKKLFQSEKEAKG